MFKPTFLNVLFYFYLKYSAFAIVMAILGDRFKTMVIDNAQNRLDLFTNVLSYWLYVLFHIGMQTLVLFVPFYFSLRVKHIGLFIPIVLVAFGLEYFFYTWSSSQDYPLNGLYNGMISMIFFIIFFYKHIGGLRRTA